MGAGDLLKYQVSDESLRLSIWVQKGEYLWQGAVPRDSYCNLYPRLRLLQVDEGGSAEPQHRPVCIGGCQVVAGRGAPRVSMTPQGSELICHTA
jgi:hypothetical protein